MSITRRGFLTGAALAGAGIIAGTGTGCAPMSREEAAAQSRRAASVDGEPAYDYEADVIAVGGGAAGFMACSAAHDEGASTLLIEKSAMHGGDSNFALGIQAFWPERRLADGGKQDSAEEFLSDWKATHENRSFKGQRGEEMPDEFPLTQRYIELWPEVGDYLVENLHAELLSMSGAEDDTAAVITWDTGNGASPCTVAPTGRTWLVTAPIVSDAEAVLSAYDDFTELTGCEVTSLVQNEEGSVVGVCFFDDKGTRHYAKANKGVIMCTGSFCANPSMISEYINPLWAGLRTSGVVTNSGDGIKMAKAVGGALADMDLGFIYLAVPEGTDNVLLFESYMSSFSAKLDALALNVPGILVNREGQRIMAESRGYPDMSVAIADSSCYLGYYVCDSTIDASLLDDCVIRRADTVEELARTIGVDAGALAETVARYNGFVDAGTDTDFGKNMAGTVRLEQPPFFAVRLDPRPYMSLGGIKTDVDSRVLDESGNPIPGFYAAGVCCGSYWEQEGLVYNGGLNQAVAFGYQAGRIAATEA
ncbi:FAD-dependent oxidoreductase [Eggerthella sinensis]|uniref:FAD-dependent oxidoreductase n=1 Tax=Eggerthella sinensis TaxID=242230 RepID=UPI00266C7ED8|nr:FAD-binding protein [Eggerthella sinensis]